MTGEHISCFENDLVKKLKRCREEGVKYPRRDLTLNYSFHLVIAVPRAHRGTVNSVYKLAGPVINISQSLGDGGELFLAPLVHTSHPAAKRVAQGRGMSLAERPKERGVKKKCISSVVFRQRIAAYMVRPASNECWRG